MSEPFNYGTDAKHRILDEAREVREQDEANAKAFTEKLDAFTKMVVRHDLTYAYSDDHRYWQAGRASAQRIEEARKQLPWAIARAIWNAEVDRKIATDAREQFYWPEEQPK
jgi:vacuolar-type H+-ATPase subunit H